MTLDRIEKRIETLLASEKRWPVIVDFSNKDDVEKFIEHFKVGENRILSAGAFCGKDETLRIEELTNTVENNTGNTFIVGLTVYLKLNGESALKNVLKTILSKSINGHVIIVLYQCRNFLKFSDSRYMDRGQLLVVDGDFDTTSSICLVTPEVGAVFANSIIGFEYLGDAYEKRHDKKIHVVTSVKKSTFNVPMITITQLTNSYEILCDKDERVRNVPESFGTKDQWGELLREIGSTNLEYCISTHFGSVEQLSHSIYSYPEYSDKVKWIYFIAISIYGTKKNTYLSRAIENALDYKSIPKSLYQTLLSVDSADEDFEELYDERKEILKYFTSYLEEAVDYCKVLASKQEKAIYYLTDYTQPERERIIEWLNLYGINYNIDDLRIILSRVYPDLADYLTDYRFKNDLLDSYFSKYKYQKLVNKILPEFDAIVGQQATEHNFVGALQPRTQLFEKVNLDNSHVYFVDALGVEYIGFILEKCKEHSLSAKVMCGRCELPSLTCFNKEFYDVCNAKGCPVSDIKDIDEIKHHGEDNFNYEKNKLPLHIISELNIIKELIKKIQVALIGNQYEKAVIVSDHGASRLAVLHETENVWQMESKGVHSGRCCPINEINDKPSFAIEESGYWVLANYDRFKGSRKANVEVHGGASIEEVAVPIIEITKKSDNISAFIIEEYRIITLAALECPIIRIYVGVISNSISVKINNKYYDAVDTNEKYVYEVKLSDVTKKGKYLLDILNGSDVISSNNELDIQKKGMSEVSLFD